ncbi:glutathione s-transferase [Stylonychia lemnae]|uniref:Glutathione s-transferase n=1 Tax=Stylonychia lemnae TaxID=5949 RepID=A0A078ARL6_STYLE|nr:glutathione s-transferase [Stylonychia lemnae]|eukprot:CDW83852.1 glutathione s-transferase [Stylonychia lemnae]
MYGDAEPIRMLLSHAGISYEDIYMNYQEFQKIKEKDQRFEFQRTPILELDGQFYAQSYSILRLLGKMYGYYPENSIEAWKVDSVMDQSYDLEKNYLKQFFQTDKEKAQNLKDNYFQNQLPTYCEKIQKRLIKAGNIFIAGEQLTIADFVNVAWAYILPYNIACQHSQEHIEVISKYPDLVAYFDRMTKQVKDHLDKRPLGLGY